MNFAEQAASVPPVPERMCKQSINTYNLAVPQVASHSDFDQFALAQTGEDYAEGVSAFLQKREPRYTGN